MAYINEIWNELINEVKAEFPEVNAIFRFHQVSRRNWGDLLKAAEGSGTEERMPWVIVAMGPQNHDPDGPITSVTKRMMVSIVYVCKYDEAEDIDFHVEQKVRGLHDRLVAGSFTYWQFPLDGNTGTLHFTGTDNTGIELTARQEPVFSGTYEFEVVIGEIAPVND